MPISLGQRIKAARTMAGLSMDALVAQMDGKLSKVSISKYERGIMVPDSENLIRIARALGVSVDYLFSQKEVSLSHINFRKKASLGKKAEEALRERIKDQVGRYLELEELMGLASVFSNPLAESRIKTLVDVESAAARLRKEWGCGRDCPLPSLFELFEDKGIKLIAIPGEPGFDGLSGDVDGHPVIILNDDSPADRKRLTALHELAHLCLEFDPSLSEHEKERLCHSFGAAFLLPPESMEREIGAQRSGISWVELRNLKQEYGISMQAIMYRARQRGIISEYAHEAFSKALSAKRWRKEEPWPYPGTEEPHRFHQLLHRALAEGAISISKAAELSRRSIESIQREISTGDAAPHP